MAFHSDLSDYFDWTQKMGKLDFSQLRWLSVNVESTMAQGVERQ